MLVLEMNIESYSLRLRLNQELQNIYEDNERLFTPSFNKETSIFTIRRWSEPTSDDEDDNRPKKKRKKKPKKSPEVVKLSLD